MNEIIGVKGGKNDRKRSIRIKKKQKEKLKKDLEEKELKELEKEVKKKQISTFVKMIPFVIVGGTVKTILDTASKDSEKERIIREISDEYGDILKDNPDIEITNENKIKKTLPLPSGETVVIEIPKSKEKELDKRVEEINEKINEIPTNKEPIEIKEYGLSEIDEDKDFINLNDSQKEKLRKLKERKIYSEYEKELKDLRYDLRKVIYAYNTLDSQSEELIISKEAEEVLDRLTEIIEKLEYLKRKIRIDNLDKYDDNYIYTLIEDYLSEFKDRKVIKDIKDSPLYISISEKIDELDNKKTKLNKKVKDKKEKLLLKEEKFDKLKNKYEDIESINKRLEDYVKDQEKFLKEIEEKVNNATTITEKVEVKMKAIDNETKRLQRLLTILLFIPGPKSAKQMAITSAIYMYTMKRLMKDNTETKKYKVIKVEDYSDDLEKNIKSVKDAEKLLSKTGKKIDEVISEIEYEFKDYLGVIKEADEILSNLNKVKKDIKEKEYEMNKMLKEQEKILENNNAKLLKRGEYPSM